MRVEQDSQLGLGLEAVAVVIVIRDGRRRLRRTERFRGNERSAIVDPPSARRFQGTGVALAELTGASAAVGRRVEPDRARARIERVRGRRDRVASEPRTLSPHVLSTFCGLMPRMQKVPVAR